MTSEARNSLDRLVRHKGVGGLVCREELLPRGLTWRNWRKKNRAMRELNAVMQQATVEGVLTKMDNNWTFCRARMGEFAPTMWRVRRVPNQ